MRGLLLALPCVLAACGDAGGANSRLGDSSNPERASRAAGAAVGPAGNHVQAAAEELAADEDDVTYYDDSAAPLHIAIKVCRNREPDGHPNVSCYIGWDYALVGGGAYAASTGPGAFLLASEPDGSFWQARSSDTSPQDSATALDPHVLYTYAIGIRLDGISMSQLRSRITYGEKTSGSADAPAAEFEVGAGMMGGGLVSSDPTVFLTRSLAISPTQWLAAAKSLLPGTPGQVTAKVASITTGVVEGFGALEIMQRKGEPKTGTGVLTVQSAATDGYAVIGYGADGKWEDGEGRFVTQMGMGTNGGEPDPRTIRASSADHDSSSRGSLASAWTEARKRVGSHGLCSTGAALAMDMDPCVAKVCAENPSCCNRSWDASCVNAVSSQCDRSCEDSTCSLPGYNPSFWNDGLTGTVQPKNNCYNYATNRRTDSFAQPGDGSSPSCRSSACNTVKTMSERAVRDGLIPTTAGGTCPDNRDKLALVIAPREDFHWYRQGSDGMWSHKPGKLEATNLDNSGNTIANPETADRDIYTEFAGYFCACSSSIEGQGHSDIY